MSKISSTITLGGNYPAVQDTHLGGGYRIVNTTTDLTNIPLERLKLGTLVYVNGINGEYRYNKTEFVDTDGIQKAPSNNFPADQDLVNQNGLTSVVTNTTYLNLMNIIYGYSTSQLTPGTYYTFQYTASYIDRFSDPYQINNGSETLVVLVIDVDKISPIAYSIDFPEDIIYFSLEDNTQTNHLFYNFVNYTGNILKRIDTKRELSAPYDQRNILIRKQAQYPNLDPAHYNENYPYQSFNFSVLLTTNYPIKSFSIDVTQYLGSTQTINIIPPRYLRNIHEVCQAINRMICTQTSGNDLDDLLVSSQVVDDTILISLTKWVYDSSLIGIKSAPLQLQSNLVVTDINDNVINIPALYNNYPGALDDNSQTFYTFDSNRGPLVTPARTDSCVDIILEKSNEVIIRTTPFGATLSNIYGSTSVTNVLGAATILDLNPMDINNSCYYLSNNIESKGQAQVIDNTESCNLDGFKIQVSDSSDINLYSSNNLYLESNFNVDCINSNNIYLDVNSKNIKIDNSNYIVIGTDCNNLQFQFTDLFVNVGSTISNKSIDKFNSNFTYTVTSGDYGGILGDYQYLTLHSEHIGEIELIDMITPATDGILELRPIHGVYPLYNILFTNTTGSTNMYGSSILAPLNNQIYMSSSSFNINNTNMSSVLVKHKYFNSTHGFFIIDNNYYI